MKVKNRIYYWNSGDNTYVPNELTRSFIDKVYDEDTDVVQIVGAHMHASWDGYVTEGLKEHIFGPVFEGNIGVIHVRGGNDRENESVSGNSGKVEETDTQ